MEQKIKVGQFWQRDDDDEIDKVYEIRDEVDWIYMTIVGTSSIRSITAEALRRDYSLLPEETSVKEYDST